MPENFNSKEVALITGASSGFGLEFAKIFAENNYNLVLVARSREKLAEAAKRLKKDFGADSKIIAKDLSSQNSAVEIFNELRKEKIFVDVLVNNAGFGDFGFFVESDYSKTVEMLQVNIVCLTMLSRLFGAEMVKRGKGKILNIASTAAFQPGPLMAVYYASKAYVLSFSEGLANELEGTGVSLTVLCPGPTKTGFQKRAELQGSKILNRVDIMDSEMVARQGFNALMEGRTIIVTGLKNELFARLVRFFPRAFAVKFVRWLQERK